MQSELAEAIAGCLDKGMNTKKEIAAHLRAKGLKFMDRRFKEAFEKVWQPFAGPLFTGLPAVSLAEPEAIPAPQRPLKGGRLKSPDEYRPSLAGKRFVFTTAQNNTDVHADFWEALQWFCYRKGAQLGVAKITYNKGGWQKNGGISKKMSVEDDNLWYDPKIQEFEIFQQVKVAEGLVFCGELDILPTAVFPLNGLANYTGPNSAIVPHTKMQMQSLATMKHEQAKHLYSTGACTLRNYIQRRAGQIAEYNHVYGAVYVEVDADGDWFVRQLNADDDGVFYDLDTAYGPGWDRPAKHFGQSIVNLGDIHVEKLDPVAFSGALDMLKLVDPSHVFVHDLIDFEARNHHNKKDMHFLVEQEYMRNASVREGIKQGAEFMSKLATTFKDALIISVRSNHDEALHRWLREPCEDPINLPYWHELNYLYMSNLEKGIKIDVFDRALRAHHTAFVKNIQYLQEDHSYVLKGIEFGMHGHLGPNGARGNPRGFRQIGRRANTGHTHTAGIIDGIYTAGLLGYMDMGYNKGPSSWSCSHILTYPNGKRTIITQRGKKWRAE